MSNSTPPETPTTKTYVTSKEEAEIFDEISHLAKSLWEKSEQIEGLTTDPKMFSIMLFKRLWSNHRSYALLHNNHFGLESDIILRSGLEAAICIAANFRLQTEFVTLMHLDAAFTIQQQIKMHKAEGGGTAPRGAQEALDALLARLPPGKKPAKLDWKSLAESGKASQLYGFHRMLSGVSSHVTGVSVIKGAVGSEGREMHDELRNLSRKMHLMMMAGATLQACTIHAGMIGDDAAVLRANELSQRLSAISMGWPGVGNDADDDD